MKEFSQNLKLARLKSGKSKKDIARAVNVSIASIENWENGRSLPNLINLLKLCKILNCSSDELLGVVNYWSYIICSTKVR